MAESSGNKKGNKMPQIPDRSRMPQYKRMTQCLQKWNETSVKTSDSLTSIRQPVFKLTVKYSIPELMIIINMQNLCQQVVIIRSILLYGDTRHVLFDGVLRMVPGYEFVLEKRNIHTKHNHIYNAVILAKILGTNYELRETFMIQFLSSRERRGLPLKLRKLPPFSVPAEVKEVYSNGFLHNPHYSRPASLWLDHLEEYKIHALNPSNYVDYLKMLNQIDQHDNYMTMCQYTIEKAILIQTHTNCFLLSSDQFKEPPCLLDVGCFANAFVKTNNMESISRGVIMERNTSFLISMTTPLRSLFPRLEFPQNLTQFQIEYQSLHRIGYTSLKSILFPAHGEKVDKPDKIFKGQSFTSFEWFHPQIAKNKQQKHAIKNIVNRTAYPAPYILFGPPGTGKTLTIVEAVLQIWKLRAKSRILVTATSNFACNELATRLLKYVKAKDLFRYFAYSAERSINEMDPKVLHVSNMYRGVYETPAMEDFTKTRILVCTVMNSGRLMQLGVDTNIYDYIFIDECGSSKEISALVPIGIGTSTYDTKLHASIVLAGDPKQLGPVTRFEYLKQTPHNTSLLERLMELPFYRKDHNNNGYNTQVIMKLLDNYRSHASLIEFSNREFYESELRAKGPPTETAWAVNWQQLPNPKFPMFFVSVFGQMNRNPVSLSYCNRDEAKVVFRYVQLLVKGRINNRIIRPEDIGIVTPYSSQVEYIRNGLSKLGFDAVEIGSAEQYQGREKPVIIISTVRSNTNSVGFLADHRRLNVVLTRAQALCIIIGNPNTLMLDKTWYSLLAFIKCNNAVCGRNFRLGHVPYSTTIASSYGGALDTLDFV